MIKSFYPIKYFWEWILYNVSIPCIILLGLFLYPMIYMTNYFIIIYFVIAIFAWISLVFVVLYFRDKFFVSYLFCKNYSRVHLLDFVDVYKNNHQIETTFKLDRIEKYTIITKDDFKVYKKTVILKKWRFNKTFTVDYFVDIIILNKLLSLDELNLVEQINHNSYIFAFTNSVIECNKNNSFGDICISNYNSKQIVFHKIPFNKENQFKTHLPIFLHNSSTPSLIPWIKKNAHTESIIYDHALSKIITKEFLSIINIGKLKKWHIANSNK
ncbi:MAG: hypothetical protein V1920_02965 [Bacillota bacterium]